MNPIHPVLDRVAVNGFTLRGWIERGAKACRRHASALRADTAQSDPLAREWDAKAQALENLILDLEAASLPEDREPAKP